MRFMHFMTVILAALGLSSGAACAATISYNQIHAFGDSLSDAGNIYDATAQGLPVSPPYANGRFTNGKVWVQDLAQKLGQSALRPSLKGGNDFAYGGAQTGTTIAHNSAPIDLSSQLDQFEAQTPNPARDALYTLWIGANDVNAFISGVQSGQVSLADAGHFIDQATSNVGDAVDRLAGNGLQHLLALDVPDLSKTPNAIEAANQTDDPSTALGQIKALTRAFDDALDARLRSVARQDEIDLVLGNTFDRIDQIIANPQEFGFSNVTDPCWTGGFTNADSGSVCDNPDEHLFWDGLHPTRHGHQVVADVAGQKLGTGASVPEPNSAGLFAVGVLALAGWVGYRRRRSDRSLVGCER